MEIIVWGFFVFVLLNPTSGLRAIYLEDYVKHYEQADLTTVIYPQVAPDSGNFAFQVVQLHAFGREFTLELRRGYSRLIGHNANIMSYTRSGIRSFPIKKYISNVIEGEVKGEKYSFIHGTFNQGALHGVMRTIKSTYYLEPSIEFFRKPYNYSTIIFRQEDLNATGIFECKQYETCDYPLLSYLLGPYANETIPIKSKKPRIMKYITHLNPIEEDARPAIVDEEDQLEVEKANVCHLSLVAEHTFFQEIGKRSFQNTMENMLYYIEEANIIFKGLDLKSVWGEDVFFQIYTVYIHKSVTEPNYPLYLRGLTAEEFLQKLAEYDFDGYCLGIAFAFRPFPKRVLGLAYLGDPNEQGTLGGICQERKFVHTNQKSMSYNVAFVTANSKGKMLPKILTAISLAHELGHSFGSHHDPIKSSACSPKEADGGSYIMAEQAVEGDHRNNRMFSSCSKKSINEIINSKAYKCFAIKLPICGNAIPEAFEECDCGHPMQCAENDACCTPQGGIDRDAECTYRRMKNSECSPKKDGCCTEGCKIVAVTSHKLCSSLTCHMESFCDGKVGQCPYSKKREEATACYDRTGLCIKGNCIQRICDLKIGLVPCECQKIEFRCHVCCQGQNDTCKPAVRYGLQARDGMPVLRRSGEPCAERSMCNQLGDCVDAYEYAKKNDESEGEEDDDLGRTAYLDGLVIAMIVTLVLLSLGIFTCIVICFSPLAKFLAGTSSVDEVWAVRRPCAPSQEDCCNACSQSTRRPKSLQFISAKC